MNSSQLHLWMLRNVSTAAQEALDAMGALIASDDENERRQYYVEAGRHQGILQCSTLLFDLISELHTQEQANFDRLEQLWELGDATPGRSQDA